MTASKTQLLIGLLVTGVALAAPAHAADEFVIADLEPLFAAAERDTGPPLRVYSVELSRDGGAELLVQRNERRDLVDRFELAADGTIAGPSPVKFSEYPAIDAIDYHVIDAATIDLAVVRRLPGIARTKLGMPQARVASIKLEREDTDGFLSYENAAVWSVRLDEPRHDGYAQIGLDGKVLHAQKE